MRSRLVALISLTAALVAATSVAPAAAVGPPRTLAAEASLGPLDGPSRVLDPEFPVDYLGMSWTGTAQLAVRFVTDGTWTSWQEVEDDGYPADGRSFAELITGGDADGYQLRGRAQDVRVTAINTTDGPRPVRAQTATAEAALAQPGVISREQWGADEGLRFEADGTEVWPPTFHPTQKLIVHHTVTKNDDPDPAGTVRAIYRYHAVDKGWGDIGYNFLVDAEGRIYKGRWSGPAGSRTGDTVTGEDADGKGVTGAHVGGWNSGTMGIAVLGDYDKAEKPTAASLQALVDHLAWESQRHGLDPEGESTFTNPVNGAKKFVENISAHRDWASTACPGRHLYAELPGIRTDAAAVLAADADADPDTTAPAAPTGLTAAAGKGLVTLDWADSAESDLSGYAVERSTNAGTTWSHLTSTTGSGHTDPEVEPGTTYSYRVTATDTSRNTSPPSDAVSAVPREPEVENVDASVLDKGTLAHGTTADLAADDDATYDVDSVRQGRAHVTQWTATIPFASPSTAYEFTVVLVGSATAQVSRVLSVYDASTGTWTDLRSDSLNGTDEATLSWTSQDRGLLTSGGELQVRVRTSGSAAATSRTDLLHAVVLHR
jgi:hypothetical protein